MYEYICLVSLKLAMHNFLNPTIYIKNKHNWTQQQMRLEQTSTLQ